MQDNITKNINSLPIYKRLLMFLSPYRGRLFAALFCMLLAALSGVLPPWLIKNLVDDVLVRGDIGVLNLIIVGIMLLYALKGLFGYGQIYLMTWVTQRVILDLRLQLYRHTQKLSFSYIHKRRIGELTSRITGDVSVIQDIAASVLVDLVIQGVTFLGILCFLFFLNWKLTLATFAVLPLTAFVIALASKKLRKIGHATQEQQAQVAGAAQEALASLRIVRAFATEDLEASRFEVKTGAHFKELLRGTQARGVLEGVVEMVLIAAMSLILWLGGRDVVLGKLTAGELVAFLTYIGLLVQPIRILSKVASRFQQGIASAERVFEILDEPEDVLCATSPIRKKISGQISFHNVHYSYEKNIAVLRGINLDVSSGENIAIVGATGGGKSTLADMILRFFDPTEGLITADGVDIKLFDVREYRAQIGLVPQDPILLKGSFAFNISYGMGACSTSAIEEAAATAGIHDFIVSCPKGYDTEVGERGVTLSGGQRQRVAIARAIVRDPKILILDEATSSLDAKVEQQIQTSLNKAMSNRTSFVIAHRLSTVKNADRIIVLEKGVIVEEGSHDKLMNKGSRYAELHNISIR